MKKKDQTFQKEIYRDKAEFDKEINYNDLIAEWFEFGSEFLVF